VVIFTRVAIRAGTRVIDEPYPPSGSGASSGNASTLATRGLTTMLLAHILRLGSAPR